jgi:formylglycine-generating enzyme required for sulfatase activity
MQTRQSDSGESFATAKALDRIPVTPEPAEPHQRTAAVPEPGPEMKPAKASAKDQPATKDTATPSSEAAIEKPQAQERKESTATKRPLENSGPQSADLSTEQPPRAGINGPQVNEPDANTLAPAPPPEDSDEEEPAQVAKEEPVSRPPDASAAPPALAPEKPALEKAPGRVAKAELPPSPLPEASALSPAGFTFKDCDFCPTLVVMPKGEFMMGSNEQPHERPAHKVQIAYPFAIGQHKVTYAEWGRCVEAGACRYRPESPGSPNDPIGNLSWDDANAYLKWLSGKTGQTYRLPSEAEWEYATRAGGSKSSAAGSQKTNSIGLSDTAGKMAEWVEDCWNDSFRGAPADGSAWIKGNCGLRALRGGSFGSTSRYRYDSDVRYEANGFRVLRELR